MQLDFIERRHAFTKECIDARPNIGNMGQNPLGIRVSLTAEELVARLIPCLGPSIVHAARLFARAANEIFHDWLRS